MTAPVPYIPDHAPFSAEQRAWLNGFLAGIFSRQQPTLADGTAPPPAARPLTILWGSQTGTAEALAKRAAKQASTRGFAATVMDLGECDLNRLAGMQNVLLITSTYGDGEPPDNARSLHDALRAAEPGLLSPTFRYAVCALGDSSYTLFCQCGKDFDSTLEQLGGTRVAARVDCDVDYDAPFEAWLEAALGALSSSPSEATDVGGGSGGPAHPAGSSGGILANLSGENVATTAAPPATHSKTHPFLAAVLKVDRINGAGSAKEVNHIELSLDGSGLTYEAGDALGVWPHNCTERVDEILTALRCDGEEPVLTAAGERPLRTALLQHFDLGKPTPELSALIQIPLDPARPQVIDLLLAPDARVPEPKAFAAALKKLQPRLYSISSSPKAHPGQVHLTVGAVRYEAAGRIRKGVCSTFLADRAAASGAVAVYVHANKGFRPPSDPSAPMIMIGPGTGIAPFRAFLEERAATGAKGPNWLFFGDQTSSHDFLYRSQLEDWHRSGLLTRLDTAFSRDQAHKVYVQHRMLEQAAELWAWLESGAHVYVCGDATRMAKDVDAALHRLIETAGRRSAADAAAYVKALRGAKRYARDVY